MREPNYPIPDWCTIGCRMRSKYAGNVYVRVVSIDEYFVNVQYENKRMAGAVEGGIARCEVASHWYLPSTHATALGMN